MAYAVKKSAGQVRSLREANEAIGIISSPLESGATPGFSQQLLRPYQLLIHVPWVR